MKLSTMAPTVMACALVTAVAFPLLTAVNATTCNGQMQSTDPSAVCYDHFGGRIVTAQSDSDALRAEAAQTAGRKCYAPADLPKGVVPSWVVMRRTDGTVVGEKFDAAWAEAKAGTAWTISVCA